MAGTDSAWARHDAACRRNAPTYTDPDSGYQVFTAAELRRRGRCCGSGCRHCPYHHQEIPLSARGQRIQQPAWLTEPPEASAPRDVLFWSGGKDSFLACRALARGGARPVLLTTFDGARRRVAHQDVTVADVVAQARVLGLPLIGVPLQPGRNYRHQVLAGLDLVAEVRTIAFGDLHLRHIRRWREREFAPYARRRQARLAFPLWHVDYAALTADLEASGAECRFSAVLHPALGHVRVGDRYDRHFLARLPPGVDAFGEQGEFHTLIEPAVPVTRPRDR